MVQAPGRFDSRVSAPVKALEFAAIPIACVQFPVIFPAIMILLVIYPVKPPMVKWRGWSKRPSNAGRSSHPGLPLS